MKMSGWFKVHRQVFNHELFEGETYSKREAWLYIIARACFEPTKFNLFGDVVTVQRGEMYCTERELAERFGWTKNKVRYFISQLVSRGMVQQILTQKPTKKKTKIFVVNYGFWQDEETKKPTTEKPISIPQKKNIRNKEIILLRNIIESFEIDKDFIPLLEKWLDYKKDKKQSYKSEASLKAFYDKLTELSGGSITRATKIIEQSLANNWSGIFELKPTKTVEREEFDYEKLSR